MNQEESFSDELYRTDDYRQDYGPGSIGFSYPSSSFQNTQFMSPFYTWYHPYAPYYQPYGYDPFPYQYHPSQPGRGKGPGKGPGKRPEDEPLNPEVLRRLEELFAPEIGGRPVFHNYEPIIPMQLRARISRLALARLVRHLRAKGIPFLIHVADGIERVLLNPLEMVFHWTQRELALRLGFILVELGMEANRARTVADGLVFITTTFLL